MTSRVIELTKPAQPNWKKRYYVVIAALIVSVVAIIWMAVSRLRPQPPPGQITIQANRGQTARSYFLVAWESDQPMNAVDARVKSLFPSGARFCEIAARA